MPLANTGIIYIIFVSRGMYRNRNSYIPCLPDKELRELQTSLARCNPYVNQFKKYLEVAIETIVQLVEDDSNRKQHALPQSDVIGILVPGNIGHNNTHRNLFVKTKSSEAKTISDLHPCYDPFSNVLLHPSGGEGYSLSLHYNNHNNRITPAIFYTTCPKKRPIRTK